MPVNHEGQLQSSGLRFAIVASRFNGTIVDLLVNGAVDAIVRTWWRMLVSRQHLLEWQTASVVVVTTFLTPSSGDDSSRD